jgi:hypothetical protein
LQINKYIANSHILELFNLPAKYHFWLSSLEAATVQSVLTMLYPVMTNNHHATRITSLCSETAVIDFDWSEIKPASPKGKLETKSYFILRKKQLCCCRELNYEGWSHYLRVQKTISTELLRQTGVADEPEIDRNVTR